MRSILFRCDSSNQIGLGHVTRSLAFAQAFVDKNWKVTFFGNFNNPSWLNNLIIKQKNISFENIQSEHVFKQRYDLVVVDSYTIESNEFDKLSTVGKKSISIIDDISPELNTNFYTSSLPYEYLPKFKSIKDGLFGPKYALIRQEITNAPKFSIKVHASPLSVALFLGGSLNIEFAELILNQLISKVNDRKIKIFSNDNQLKLKYENITSLVFIPPKTEFFNELFDVDLVIAPASVSSWEFLCMGFPLSIYGIHENQLSTYKYLVENNYARGLGVVSNYHEFVLDINQLDNALNGPVKRGIRTELIDGFGSSRVYEEIINNL